MILKLLKIKFLGLADSVKSGNKKKGTDKQISKGKIALLAFLYLYLAAFFVAFASFFAYSLGNVFVTFGFDSLYFGLFMTVTFTLVFVLSIFETKATLYESRDNELLLSMPIPVKSIIISRIFTVLIYNYIETAVIMVPVIVVYGILGGSIIGIIGGVIVSLFLPLLATALASGVGYLVALISRRLKKNTLVTVIISLLFMAAYFAGYNYLMSSIENLAEVTPELAASLAENMGVFGVIGTAAMLNPIAISVIILISVGASALAYYLISKNYISIITKKSGSARKAYKAENNKKKSAFIALTVKELRAFFTSANYILNAGLGAVFGIVIAVMAFVNRMDIMTMVAEISLAVPELSADIEGAVAVLASAVLFAASSMTFISAPALSLEGKSLWILKSLPVSGREVLFAKTMPHLLITSSVSLISSVIMIAALEISPIWWAFVILIPLVGAAFGAFFGSVLGAAFPKFDYISEIQVIKQSLVSFLSMFSTMIFGLGIAIGSFFLMGLLAPVYVGLILLFGLIILTSVLAALLATVMARKFDKISN